MRESQWKRIIKALFRGEHINRLWAANQMPIISQPGNRCNELIMKGLPIEKKMVYTDTSKYMDFWIEPKNLSTLKQQMN